MSYFFNKAFIHRFLIILVFFISYLSGPITLFAKQQNNTIDPKQAQSEVRRRVILDFMRQHEDRKPGEGWLFLAEHYYELNDTNRALMYLRTLLRASHIKPLYRFRAKYLKAKILNELDKHPKAIKELERLLQLDPEREYYVKAKLLRAQIKGRHLTCVNHLVKAFTRYYSNFPEQRDIEAIEYLMGFLRGYDLEIAVRAMIAWEEITEFSEKDAANEALLRIGMLHAFDLNNPQRAIKYFNRISNFDDFIDLALIKAVIYHFYIPDQYEDAFDLYWKFISNTDSLKAYRVASLLKSQLLLNKLEKPDEAVIALEGLFESPAHLVATKTINIEEVQLAKDKEIDWAILAGKVAGHICEYQLKNPDRARYYYQKALEANNSRKEPNEEPWLRTAMSRTAPAISQAQMYFEKAYEKYRAGKLIQAVNLYEYFIEKFPQHDLVTEALYRVAVITDDDLKNYDKALELYQRYLILYSPVKSTWNLDVLYHWGRIDEVRYRIGNLLYLRLKRPVAALEIFDQLVEIYPDSYWAQQGIKDSVKIYREDLGDLEKANQTMHRFIRLFPENYKSDEYRLILYRTYLRQNEQLKALNMLRDYLDHILPSDSGYFEYKQQYRDLSFRISENSLRKRLEHAGPRDTIDTYYNLMEVVSLASTSKPLKALTDEIGKLDIEDELRWSMLYKAASHMYLNYPNQAKNLFEELSKNAKGPALVTCLLTLGNIAYRIERDIPNATKYYEKALQLLPKKSPLAQQPLYRLGRLYLASGHGIKGLETLQKFISRFPRSRYMSQALITMGDAYKALHHPERAERFYRRAIRLSPELTEALLEKIENASQQETSQEWLARRAAETRQQSIELRTQVRTDTTQQQPYDELEDDDIYELEAENLYSFFLDQNSQTAPDFELMSKILYEILNRQNVDELLREKSLRHYVSCNFFRNPNPQYFIESTQELLLRHNYASWQSELLFRLAQTLDHYTNDYAEANRSYFEYLSFYPEGKRVNEIRRRIPQVYVKLYDYENAYRFFNRYIQDNSIKESERVDASLELAALKFNDDKKEEAIKTLQAALALESNRRPEIAIRLERLTENFQFVRRALEMEGKEEFRFQALQRLVQLERENEKYDDASKIINQYAHTFEKPESLLWIERELEDLSRRDAVGEIEYLIDTYPEEPETPSRMFRLAQMIEGMQDTRYRAQDLFYEITLVYPQSRYFRESRIRAENVHTIRAVSELSDMLQLGLEPQRSQEVIIERARLLRDQLHDISGAMENYDAFIALFPNSSKISEVYLAKGDLTLAQYGRTSEALQYWRKGLANTSDPFMRQEITTRINNLQKFRERVLYSESDLDINNAIRQVLKAWRLSKDYAFALGMLKSALAEIENRPHAARLKYLAGRINEDRENYTQALSYYEKALRSFYHPGCRKDMLLYRTARIHRIMQNQSQAEKTYLALIRRYPKSLLNRSAFYWLYKLEKRRENYNLAHHFLTRLLKFYSVYPSHREQLLKKQQKLESKMSLADIKRLQSLSTSEASQLPFFTARILERHHRDYKSAIEQYKIYLQTAPSIAKSREIISKIADLYEKSGNYIQAVVYLDQLLDTYEPSVSNMDLILRIGTILEDKLKNLELAEYFYGAIESDYRNIRKIRRFAAGKLRWIEKTRIAAATRPRERRTVKREYSQYDNDVLDELKEIVIHHVNQLQDYRMAERHMEDLWNEHQDSLATLDIMRTLYDLNIENLIDPQKAGMYHLRWLEENSHDPLFTEYTLKLYEHYMEVERDGHKALRLLQDYVDDHPVTADSLHIELKIGLANEQLIGNYDEARRTYQRIIDTRTNDPIIHEAYFRLGHVLRNGFADHDQAIATWQELIDSYYNNEFADRSQFAIAYTYENYVRNFTLARQNYERVINRYPNSRLQNEARDGLLRVEGR